MRLLARLPAALFALWFALVLGDPGALHSCPMHGGQGGHGAARMAAAHGAGHHGVVPAADHPTDGGHRHDAGTPCSCVGHCGAASSVTIARAALILHVPVVVAEDRRPAAPPASGAPAWTDVRLPFANGPPGA